MKKLILVLSAAALLFACGNKNQFTLNGTITPATEGKLVLYAFQEGQPMPTDTVEMVDGKFKFQGEVTIPSLRLIGKEGTRGYLAQVFVESGKIDMTIYPDSFEANVIKGSKSQDLFQTYIDEMVTFSKKENEVRTRFQQAQATGNDGELEAVRAEYGVMVDNNLLFAKNFIAKNSTSPVSAYVYMMNFFQEAGSEELDSILNVFDPKIKESEFVSVIQKRADELRATSLGAQAPDFSLADLKGSTFKLSDFKGKVVLIDFWASWCQPCMMEMPNVIAQHNTFKDKGFEIIGVSLDREEAAWRSTVEQNKMDWTHGWDLAGGQQGVVADSYGVTSIPHTVLIDREGKIIAKNLRGEALQAKLAQLLN